MYSRGRKLNGGLFFLLTVIFVAGVVWQGSRVYNAGKLHADYRSEYAKVLSVQERLFSLNNWVNPDEEWLPKKEIAEKLRKNWQVQEETSFEATVYLLVILVFYILLTLILFRSPDSALVYRGGMIVTVSLCCLALGLFVPMLEIIAYNTNLSVKMDYTLAVWIFGEERVFLGDTVHFYQNKSVIQLITILFKSGNVVVGTAILLFSVIIPVFKLLSTYFILFVPNPRRLLWLKRITDLVGKWSMADVFVASCFLAYLSFYNMSTGVETNARTLPGLYYFLTYVVLGLISTRIAALTWKRKVSRLGNSSKM